MTYDMTTNTNPPANTLPIGAGDREAGSSPGSASRTLRERVAEAMLVAWAMHGDAMAEADAAIAEVMAWQPIETAKPHSRAIVSGWQKQSGSVKGYWWAHEDDIDENGKPVEYQKATLWLPFPSPPNRGEK